MTNRPSHLPSQAPVLRSAPVLVPAPVHRPAHFLRPALILAFALAASAPPPRADARGYDFEPGWASRRAAAADLDVDGAPDLLLAQSYLDYGRQRGRVVVLHGDPADPGYWRSRTVEDVGANPLDILVSDLDGNGLPDVATANAYEGTVTVLLLGPGGVFAREDYPATGGALGIASGDLNRDGLPDIAVAGGRSVVVLFQDGSAPGTFLAPAVIASGVSTTCIAVADMDGASGNDVVLGLYDTIEVLLQDAAVAGSFPAATPLAVPGKDLRRIVASDIDGNGRPDIACAMKGEPEFGPGSGLGLLLQDVAGGLVFDASVTAPGQPLKSLEMADMDADGTPDLLSSGSGYVFWYRQDPAARGVFSLGAQRSVGASEGGIAAADFDADGRIDAAVAYLKPYLVRQNPKKPGKFLASSHYRESKP